MLHFLLDGVKTLFDIHLVGCEVGSSPCMLEAENKYILEIPQGVDEFFSDIGAETCANPQYMLEIFIYNYVFILLDWLGSFI